MILCSIFDLTDLANSDSAYHHRHQASVDNHAVDESSTTVLERRCHRMPSLQWFHRSNETKTSSNARGNEIEFETYLEESKVLIQIDLHSNHWIAIGL